MKFMNGATEKFLTVFCSCAPSYSGFGKRTFSKMLLTLSLIAVYLLFRIISVRKHHLSYYIDVSSPFQKVWGNSH